jgi:hypothetical protein
MRAGLIGGLLICLTGSGCRDDAGTPSPIPTEELVVQTFSGTLPVGGSRFFSFTLPRDGSIKLTLLTLQENGVGSEAAVVIGIGVPAGTDCQQIQTATTKPGASPQTQGTFPQGIYCARIADTGLLQSPATFAMNIVHAK